MKMKKQTLNNFLEYILVILFFTLSLYNLPLFILSLFVSLFLLRQKHIGILKILILLVFRFIVSEGIDNISGNAIIVYSKYFALLIIAPLYLFYNYKDLTKNNTFKRFFIATMMLMCAFIIISLIGTEYPLVALMKIFNYFIPLIIIIALISMISEKEKFFYWFSNIFKIIIVFSLLLVNNPIGYLRNGISLQGILNHPNLFGILLVVGISILFIEIALKRRLTIIHSIIILIGIYELILTNSRTSLLSLVICIFLFFIVLKIKIAIKIIFLFFVLGISVILYIIPVINNFIIDYIQKGQSTDQILLSRYGQIDNTMHVLLNSPIFGIGFGIPVNRTSLELNSFVFEAGNLFFGLIIYVGILGVLIYFIYLLYIIFINTKVNRIILPAFVGSLLINMGELVMFSSNNVGIICYIIWGFYLQESLGNKNENI
ncbi:O-antigen ligase family protein [Staphylococcus equorum]|nr:O-antigen ligase family protein [Staphylococcus equorum]